MDLPAAKNALVVSVGLTARGIEPNRPEMEWLVEFEGEQRPLQTIWNDEAARIIGPLMATVEKALGNAADLEELEGLKAIVYAEETDTGAEWGFKFAGPPDAVNYAISLMGRTSPIIDPLN